MRVVVDPNVLIAAVLSARGAPAQLLERWRRGEIELIVSDRLLDALRRALDYPKLHARISRNDAEGYIELLRASAVVAGDRPPGATRSPDPDDDYLLDLAESQRAVLVTGDRHLLGLAPELPVLPPRRFLDELPG